MKKMKDWKVRVEPYFGGGGFEIYTCPDCGEETQYPMIHVLKTHCLPSTPKQVVMTVDPFNSGKGFADDCAHDYKRLQKNGDRIFYACEHCGATKVGREEE